MCPSLTIVLERSDSMLLDLAGSPNIPEASKQRWGIAKAAIARAVADYNNKLPIGMTFFPSDDLCGSQGSLLIPPAYDTQAAIRNALADGSFSPNGGWTPTCGAVGKAAQQLSGEWRDSYLLLVTQGLPSCDATCSIDPKDPAASAINAVAAAARAGHPIKTFVLAIGSQNAASSNGLTRMAAAGGVPDSNNPALKFFIADDVSGLDGALERIMHQLTQDGAGGTCDDSCTKNGCIVADDVCVQGRCRVNPCLGLSCRPGEYCMSTGTAAKCAAPCNKSCGAGTSCHLGACVREPCGAPCGAGSKCEPGSGTSPGACVPDPACTALKCGDGQGCFAGVCQSDPCQYTTCPEGLSCVPFDGSCVTKGLLMGSMEVEDHLTSGCTVGAWQGTAALPVAGLAGAALLALLGRRRRRAP
jgi:hypothetical protein